MQIYDLVTLLEIVSVFKRPKPFWLNFFTRQINFTTEKIAFDKVSEDYRRLAPFVAPNMQGKVLTREGYDTLEFKPAYVKPKHVVDPDDVLVRQPGEAMMQGSLTPEQRRNAVIANILERHANMHTMTQEWMAARAVIDGKVTIAGEGYPATLVDFRRDPSLTVTLTAGARWTETTATPLADIYTWRNNVKQLCGVTINKIIFGRDAWASFIARTDIKELLSTQRRGSMTDLSLVINNFEDDYEYLGDLAGSQGNGTLECWLYSGKYKDSADVLQDLMNPKMVVGVSPAIEGVRCFGAIKDPKAGYQALEMFFKNWMSEDPPQEYLMSQSAPLMVPRQPNASFSAIVQS